MLEQKAHSSDNGSVVLGIDYGLKRIGLALGNTLTNSARPLSIIHWTSNKEKWAALSEVIKEWQPEKIVIGIPFHKDGADNTMTPVCRNFARQVAGRFGIPCELEDERFSSVEAEAECDEEYIDDEAASIILQQWLNRNKGENQ